MLLNGTLNAHLEEVDKSAAEMFDRLVAQYTQSIPVKVINPMNSAKSEP